MLMVTTSGFTKQLNFLQCDPKCHAVHQRVSPESLTLINSNWVKFKDNWDSEMINCGGGVRGEIP